MDLAKDLLLSLSLARVRNELEKAPVRITDCDG